MKDPPPGAAMTGQGNSLVLGKAASADDDDGALVVTSACLKDDVARVILAGRDAVRACAQAHAPGASGAIETRWELDATGAPAGLSASSEREALGPVAQCVEEVIQRWRFAPLPPQGHCEVLKTFEIKAR